MLTIMVRVTHGGPTLKEASVFLARARDSVSTYLQELSVDWSEPALIASASRKELI